MRAEVLARAPADAWVRASAAWSRWCAVRRRVSLATSVSMAMTPSGPSMKDWFDRPLPTRVQTPGRTSVKARASRAEWAREELVPKPYTAGSWGPSAAIALTEREGASWHE